MEGRGERHGGVCQAARDPEAHGPQLQAEVRATRAGQVRAAQEGEQATKTGTCSHGAPDVCVCVCVCGINVCVSCDLRYLRCLLDFDSSSCVVFAIPGPVGEVGGHAALREETLAGQQRSAVTCCRRSRSFPLCFVLGDALIAKKDARTQAYLQCRHIPRSSERMAQTTPA